MAKWWFASEPLLGPLGSPASALVFLGAFTMSSLFKAISGHQRRPRPCVLSRNKSVMIARIQDSNCDSRLACSNNRSTHCYTVTMSKCSSDWVTELRQR
jgi:hypothetical protein